MDIQEELQKKHKRFQEEAEAIKSQVEFIEESVILETVREKRAYLASNLMESNQLDSDIFSQSSEVITKLSERKETLIQQLNESEYFEIPERFHGIDGRSDEGETIQFIFDMIENGEKDSQEIKKQLMIQLEAMCIINGENIGGDFYLDLYDHPQKISEYIDVCLKLNHNYKIESIRDSIKHIEHHTKLINLVNPQNAINIYRQAFIQLVAIFDAIMFEIFQIRFNTDFFNWLKFFKDGSVKYSEIASYSNFNEFQSFTINDKLKACYLKDLLIIVRNNFKDAFIINSEDCYCNFREMINRRNCHIHNNGIVDNSYLGLDNPSQGGFNIFNCISGDYLYIDKDYFNKSLNMCDEFIRVFLQAETK